MQHKVSELGGDGDVLDVLLNAAVAKADGVEHGPVWVGYADGSGPTAGSWRPWSPCTEWSDGGPIIQRERITTVAFKEDEGAPVRWAAFAVSPFSHYIDELLPGTHVGSEAKIGPTPLIAAMRAFVSAKFGDTIDLP